MITTNTRTQPNGKVSIKIPSDEWLCRKMEKLNITLTEDYPTLSSETSGLSRDMFVRVPKTQKWYMNAVCTVGLMNLSDLTVQFQLPSLNPKIHSEDGRGWVV